jgi:WD40 repeat protein
VLYDLVADTALYKLTGHKEPITALEEVRYTNLERGSEESVLISGSKDGFVKFWDLN